MVSLSLGSILFVRGTVGVERIDRRLGASIGDAGREIGGDHALEHSRHVGVDIALDDF